MIFVQKINFDNLKFCAKISVECNTEILQWRAVQIEHLRNTLVDVNKDEANLGTTDPGLSTPFLS